jgi:hypothetical protein
MRRILLGVSACVLGLALAGAAEAHGPNHRGPAPRAPARAYYRDHARHFGHGYYYAGRDHHHWSRRVWSPRFGRWEYFDPGLSCWYYWYAPAACYYPVTYCP